MELSEASWTFECALTDPSPPSVSVTTIEEALNEPYDVALVLRTPDLSLDPRALLGEDAVLVIHRGEQRRRFCGIITEVEVEVDAGDDLQHIELRLRPAFQLLSLGSDSRIFQAMTAPDIIEQVLQEALGPYEREVRVETEETYPVREYCVQYQESDSAFVSRLMEEEGISYAFDHEGEKEVIVLRDKNASFEKVPAMPEPGVLFMREERERLEGLEPIHHFHPTHQHVTTAVALRDADFTKNGLTHDAPLDGEDAKGRIRERYEEGSRRSVLHYEYDPGVRRYQKDDGERQAQLRLEAHRRDEIIVVGAVSRAIGMAPGRTFELREHPDTDLLQEYVVIRVRHTAMGAGSDPYRNYFDCIPKDTPYRPHRHTQKPRIPSIQTAIVTGPAGEEIHVDEWGRVKVQFHWDREGQLDETTSCWVRCQQAWAGNGWGSWWVPRIGMEVVVQFVDGDPDRPLVTGCVYNADNQLPYPLPDEKTKSTIKSNSSLGGEGFNEFRYEDKKGEEQIYLHAQKDLDEEVLNDHTLDVGNDETIHVHHDQRQTIDNDQTEVVHNNQHMTVDANRTTIVHGNFSETIDGDETRTVNSSVTETVQSSETITVNGGRTETVNAGSTQTINGGSTQNINGGSQITVTGGSALNVTGGQIEDIIGMVTRTASALVTNVAPSIENLDPDRKSTTATWFKTSGFSLSLDGMKIGFTGVDISTKVYSFGATAISISATGAKASFEGTDLKEVGMNNILAGIYTAVAGLEMHM